MCHSEEAGSIVFTPTMTSSQTNGYVHETEGSGASTQHVRAGGGGGKNNQQNKHQKKLKNDPPPGVLIIQIKIAIKKLSRETKFIVQ